MDPVSERRLAAILSADVVGYSRLMTEDEAGFLPADLEKWVEKRKLGSGSHK